MTGDIRLALKSDEHLSTELNKLIDDIKTLIYSPIYLGSYFYHMRITGIERIFLAEAEWRAIGIIAWEIHYYAPLEGF
jgi:hypothetical protein